MILFHKLFLGALVILAVLFLVAPNPLEHHEELDKVISPDGKTTLRPYWQKEKLFGFLWLGSKIHCFIIDNDSGEVVEVVTLEAETPNKGLRAVIKGLGWEGN